MFSYAKLGGGGGGGHFPLLVCPAEVVTARLPGSIVYANISWPTSPPGLSDLPCPCHTDTSTARAYRRCLSDGTWLTTDVSECILTVNSSVCALVSEGAPTTVYGVMQLCPFIAHVLTIVMVTLSCCWTMPLLLSSL